ncbi:MAG: hypothetical protein LUD19_00440 [Clostridia bacterium]|nr:hypothetical protein [Clostridia bacterium]
MEKVKKNYAVNRNSYLSLLLILSIAAGAVAELFAIMSSRANSGYPISVLDDVMLYSELAVGLLIAIFVLSIFLKGKISTIILDLMRLAAVALFCMCMYYVLVERADLMGYVWFSTLESDNPDSVNALNYGVISAGCYVGAIIICAVSGGFDLVSSVKKSRTRQEVLADIAVLEEELASIPAEEVKEEAAPEALPEEAAAPASAEEVKEKEPEKPVYDGPSDSFIETLSDEEKCEFKKVFLDNKPPVSGVPAYEVGGDNSKFFSAMFANLSRTRNLVSDGLMSKIYDGYHYGR